jgi:hypothetical protein
MAIEFSDKHDEIIIAIGLVESLLLVVVIVVSIDISLTLCLGDLVFLLVVVVVVVDGRVGEEEDAVSFVFFFFFFLFCLAADALDDDATDSVVPSSIDEFIDMILSSPPFINNSFVIPFLSLAGDGPRDADENRMGSSLVEEGVERGMGLSLSFFVEEGGGEGGSGDGAVHKA